MINIPIVYHIVITVVFILILFINIPKYRKRFNINNLVYVDFFNNMFSVILGFYLSAFLAIHIYNNQLEQKINDDKNNVLNYLTYLDENLREVNPDKLEEGVNMGYLNYDYFDNIQNIGNQNLNAKYFKLIGHLKYLKNTFYEVHNANLLNPKENPPRPDETKLINNTINYIKNDIKELRLGLL